MSQFIFIPARMQAVRLPNKPLATINDIPMIIHVMRRAMEADCAEVIIAAGDQEIVDMVQDYGGNAILTDNDLPSGTDRVWQAFVRSGKQDAQFIMNLQGDLPNIHPEVISNAFQVAQKSGADITTPIAPMDNDTDRDDIQNENVVKAAMQLEAGQEYARALYFSRAPIPFNAPCYYHHVGLYVFTPQALETFVGLPQTSLEKTERLEQLRALQHGMSIYGFLTQHIPLGVDTADDLEKVRNFMQK